MDTAPQVATPLPPRFTLGRLVRFISVVWGTVLLATGFIGFTWGHFLGWQAWPWAAALLALSLGFLPLMLSGWRWDHPLLRLATASAAVALGLTSYLFFGAIAAWLAVGAAHLLHLGADAGTVVRCCFAAAALVVAYGVVNASWIRVTRLTVTLAGLPPSWAGRTAAVVSDIHLGNIRREAFLRRVVRTLAALRPDIVFLSGDLFDGTRLDPARVIAPLSALKPALGSYFVTGNHDEHFSRPAALEAVRTAGLSILDNDAVSVDGVRVIGIHDEEASEPALLANLLERNGARPGVASILVTHQPANLAVAEAAGVSLQVSGHTHAGQFWPWNLIVGRVWGPFSYGLNRSGNLWVLTSSGVGTWGPPLRVGTRSEVVLLTFAQSA
jgi:uncharacterized protein